MGYGLAGSGIWEYLPVTDLAILQAVSPVCHPPLLLAHIEHSLGLHPGGEAAPHAQDGDCTSWASCQPAPRLPSAGGGTGSTAPRGWRGPGPGTGCSPTQPSINARLELWKLEGSELEPGYLLGLD